MRQLISYLLFFIPVYSLAQTDTYILNGSAQKNSCNCYTLTADESWLSGSVWNSKKIDLSQSFDFWFHVYLGCKDANGADGIVFMLQPLSTSVGSSGEGMGFSGVNPSIGIALDTYSNQTQNDPSFDHISIQANGQTNHASDLAGPVQASAINMDIEDCQWHTLRIKWNSTTKSVETYFDGELRLSKTIDLIKDIFNNDPLVYWGFSGATGGLSNLQKFCTALNPNYQSNLINDGTCIGNTIQFQDASESFAPLTSYYWSFGDGAISTLPNPQHTYSAPGVYELKMAIKALDGCSSDTLKKTITIGSNPVADFNLFDTCSPAKPRLLSSSSNIGVKEEWLINGNFLADINTFPFVVGNYQVKRVITSLYGCGADDDQQQISILPSPSISTLFEDDCIHQPVTFAAIQNDNATTISSWVWRINNRFYNNPTPILTFNSTGTFDVSVFAFADNGCVSDTISDAIQINAAFARAGVDTLVIKNTPFTLKGSGNGSFVWQPSSLLTNFNTATPMGSIDHDQLFTLTVTTDEGCIAKDSVLVSVFNGSAVYLPNAFTPNNDGLNDVFKPVMKGINSFNYFRVYNRWGQQVFSTAKAGVGWNGKDRKGQILTGTYVWLFSAKDLEGKDYQLKGTVTLIK